MEFVIFLVIVAAVIAAAWYFKIGPFAPPKAKLHPAGSFTPGNKPKPTPVPDPAPVEPPAETPPSDPPAA